MRFVCGIWPLLPPMSLDYEEFNKAARQRACHHMDSREWINVRLYLCSTLPVWQASTPHFLHRSISPSSSLSSLCQDRKAQLADWWVSESVMAKLWHSCQMSALRIFHSWQNLCSHWYLCLHDVQPCRLQTGCLHKWIGYSHWLGQPRRWSALASVIEGTYDGKTGCIAVNHPQFWVMVDGNRWHVPPAEQRHVPGELWRLLMNGIHWDGI